MSSGRCRCWAFTAFNTQEHPKDSWGNWDLRYGVYQLERAPDTGRLHFQGYLVFNDSVRMGLVSRLLPGAHLEQAKGDAQQNTEYCTKQESRVDGPWSVGNIGRTGKGKRNDLLDVQEAIKQGKSEKEISEEHFGVWLRHHNAISKYIIMHNKREDQAPDVIVLCGPTGTGKTRAAWELGTSYDNDGRVAYPYMWSGGKWFSDYAGERCVVFDEFCGQINWTLFLRLLDRYPMTVETKGGHAPWLARSIIITSNLRPDEWFKREEVKQGFSALFRRFTMYLWVDYQERESKIIVNKGVNEFGEPCTDWEF